jgi:probable F420-dependent oxidoreductase
LKIAVFADLTDQTMPLVDFAAEAEARGFSGIFLNEHTHLPVEHPTSAFPAGGPTPERYARFWDPFIALSFVAAATRLEVGTAISLVGEHDPIALAHQVATLDTLSGGRFVFGVGWGWNREEFANHGRPPEVRARVLKEWVEVMRTIWTSDVAEFSGDFVQLTPSRAWPKPVQSPHPPVLLGSPPSERNWRRIAEWCDGWITMGQPITEPALAQDVARMREVWAQAGRDARGPRLDVIYNPVHGAAPLQAAIESSRALGAERFLYHVFDGDRDQMLRRLDRGAEALASTG